MSLSTTRVGLRDAFATLKKPGQILTIMFLHFVFLSGTVILLGYFFNFPEPVWAGLVLMASVPPAVAIIPYTDLLSGDNELSVGASPVLYLSSLVITPAIVLALLGENVDVMELLGALVLMIIFPLLISRGLRYINLDSRLGDYRPVAINLSLALLFFTTIGVKRIDFIEGYRMIAAVSVICLVRTFFTGTAAYLTGKRFSVPYPRNITYTLYSSYKNLGLAIVLALGLFGPDATTPIVLCIIFEVLAFVYLRKILIRNSY